MSQISRRGSSDVLNVADIVKILESQPDLASKLRRVRGGYLKMQGTWMARDVSGVFRIR